MLRQVYEYRVYGPHISAKNKLAIWRINGRFHRRSYEPGLPKSLLTQKEFEEYMKHADEVAKKWL